MLFSPESFDEAMSQSEEEAQFNESMQFVFNALLDGLENGIIEGVYSYDGEESTATNDQGELYEREFTHVYIS